MESTLSHCKSMMPADYCVFCFNDSGLRLIEEIKKEINHFEKSYEILQKGIEKAIQEKRLSRELEPEERFNLDFIKVFFFGSKKQQEKAKKVFPKAYVFNEEDINLIKDSFKEFRPHFIAVYSEKNSKQARKTMKLLGNNILAIELNNSNVLISQQKKKKTLFKLTNEKPEKVIAQSIIRVIEGITHPNLIGIDYAEFKEMITIKPLLIEKFKLNREELKEVMNKRK